MALSKLVIHNFRNLRAVSLDLLPTGFNIFYGDNGSGKTSLLEAIYYLGHGRSHRTTKADSLVHLGADALVLNGQIIHDNEQITQLGVEYRSGHPRLAKIAGQAIKERAALLNALPMRLLDVYSNQLLTGSPKLRRNYLNWGLFYSNPEFYAIWLMLHKAMQQRNAVLKRHDGRTELSVWTQQVISAVNAFTALSANYIKALLAHITTDISIDLADYLNVQALKFIYYPGWNTTLSYGEALHQYLAKDLAAGFTHCGPHRADLQAFIAKRLVKDILSAGQQKLLVCGMMLAQGLWLSEQIDKSLLYLIDDIAAELDVHSLKWLLGKLHIKKAQVCVTVVDKQLLDRVVAAITMPCKLFHVKHGKVTEIT